MIRGTVGVAVAVLAGPVVAIVRQLAGGVETPHLTDPNTILIIVQTGALFYWGGGVRQSLRDHDRRIEAQERRNDSQDEHLGELERRKMNRRQSEMESVS